MSQPTDATHRNAGGDFFKPHGQHQWMQWSGMHWLHVGMIEEKLTSLQEAPMPVLPLQVGTAPAPAPALRVTRTLARGASCATSPTFAPAPMPPVAPKWGCTPEAKVPFTHYFLTYTFVGSRVTCNPPPLDTDQDVLVLIHECNRGVMERKMREDGYVREGSNPAELVNNVDKESVFFSYRKGDMNYIVTSSATFYERFVTATRLAAKYNLMKKSERIQLFQAVLYGKWWA